MTMPPATLKVSRQMAFQWTQPQLVALMEELDKFVSRPGKRGNFGEALEKFQIPKRTQEAWVAAMQISTLMVEQGKGLHHIKRAIVWRTEHQKKFTVEIQLFRS